MIRKVRLALPVLASLVVLVLGANAAMAAVWSSSAQYASWSDGGYTLYNDVWGSGAGPQTIWANSYSNWGVTSDQPVMRMIVVRPARRAVLRVIVQADNLIPAPQ